MANETLISSAPENIVVLRSADGSSCTKTYKLNDDGDLSCDSYGKGYLWEAKVASIPNIQALEKFLAAVSNNPKVIVVVGALTNEDNRSEIRRTKEGESATLKDCHRKWMAIDVDGVKAPVEWDGTEETLVTTLIGVRKMLPPAFQDTQCCVQLTSGYGVKGFETVRARFWFILDEPVHNEVLRSWTKEFPKELMDPSIYLACQPIYVAGPTFQDGAADPVPFPRLLSLPGVGSTVAVRQLGLTSALERVAVRQTLASSFAPNEIVRTDSQVKFTMERLLAQNSKASRHHHMLGVACELYAVGATVEEIIEVCQDLLVRQGRQPQPHEITNAIKFAESKHRAGTLTTDNLPLAAVLEDDEDETLAPDAVDGEALLDDALVYTNDDFANAKLYLRDHHGTEEEKTFSLIRWQETDYEYTGRCWRALENNEVLRSRIAKVASLSSPLAKRTTESVRNMVLKERLTMPGWIKDQRKAKSHAIVFRNGMVFVEDALLDAETALGPHDMNYFVTTALPYDYDPKADCPEWKKFVDSVFHEDPEQARELQKMMGYLLVPDNRYEKFFLLQGEPRAGKGTITSVIRALLGEENVRAVSLASLAERFGLSGLQDATVALINEANMEGMRALSGLGVDRLKMITGNDLIDVERKLKDLVSCRLPTRFVMSCNRIPSFSDPSGALQNRMHLFRFTRSFVGREDFTLKDRLLKELSGIVNWCVQGLYMLYYEDDGFKVPESVEAYRDQVSRAMAPNATFFKDCIEPASPTDPGLEKDEVYDCYLEWYAQAGVAARPLTRDKLYLELVTTYPQACEVRRRQGGERVRKFVGVRFTTEGKALVDATSLDMK